MNTYATELIGAVVLYRVPEGADMLLNSNGVKAGDVLAAIVVRQWSPVCVNLRVLCDGREDAWVTSSTRGDGSGQWQENFNQLGGQ